ncbi:MAG: flavin-dependent oxidoreductase [Geminicoccaceae bacterium]
MPTTVEGDDHSSGEQPPVLIAGAGIAGLSLALSLHQIGVACRLFEAVHDLKPLGVGINLQPHAVRELTELGLLDQLDSIGVRTAEVAYYSSHGQKIWAEPRGTAAGYRWPQFSVHRGHLQMLLRDALVERMGAEVITTGAAIETWRETATGIEVDLADRRTDRRLGHIRGSVLIACDGIHSTIRQKLYPDEGPPSWGGTVMWRGVTVAKPFLTGRTMAMAGVKARKFVCYPIRDEGEDRARINWIADLSFPPDYLWNREDWNRPGQLTDFLARFEDWQFDWLDVPALIRGAENIFEYPMVDRDPLPRWTFGPVTLMGDAAHAMYPIGSNGASQAILDARVLAREFSSRGVGPEALEAYEAERRPVTEAIVRANRGDGPDKILDIVDARAPDGFSNILEVMSAQELEVAASAYKSLAGMDVETLNARPSIVSP